jgi:hypothetical protein
LRRYSPISGERVNINTNKKANLPYLTTDREPLFDGNEATSYEEFLELDEDNHRSGVPPAILSALPVTRATTSHSSTKCAVNNLEKLRLS